MKNKNLILVATALLFMHCNSSFEMPAPIDNPALSGNPAQRRSIGETQTLVFQGNADVAVNNSETWDIPLPVGAVEARLYIFGHLLTTLHYTESARHTHSTDENLFPGLTGPYSHSHQASLYVNTAGISPPGTPGALATTGLCGIGHLSTASSFCGQNPLIRLEQDTHRHTIAPFGAIAQDPAGALLGVSQIQKTYPDHLRVLVNGEDATTLFNLDPLGDGTRDHALNETGAVADLSDLLAEAGHHRIVFQMDDALAAGSKGGRLNYVLFVRIALGPWPEL